MDEKTLTRDSRVPFDLTVRSRVAGSLRREDRVRQSVAVVGWLMDQSANRARRPEHYSLVLTAASKCLYL